MTLSSDSRILMPLIKIAVIKVNKDLAAIVFPEDFHCP